MTLKTRIYLLCSFLLVGCNQPKEKVETQMTEINNPILPGYFADPSLVQYEGKFYLYATVDPWGADFLPCWVSEDFRNWTFHRLNWPTKAAWYGRLLLFKKEICFICMYLWGQRSGVVKLPIRLVHGKTCWEINP